MVNVKSIEKVQKLLKAIKLPAIIIDVPLDLFYLTGLELSLGRLVIDHECATLFVDGRYIEACEKKKPCKVVLTQGYDSASPFFKWIMKKGYNKIGFDSDQTPHRQFEELKKIASLVPLFSPIKELRQIKEAEEIRALKKAALLGKRGFQFVKSALKVGVSEQELAQQLVMFWLENGADSLSFQPIIAFGENASQPHYRPGKRRLKKGDSVLIDIGVMKNHYASDLTRVVFFGPPNPELKKIYKIVEDAKKAAIAVCRPGISMGEIDKAARSWIEKKGYGKYFNHSLGHGVGLEVHELPLVRSTKPHDAILAAESMVFTIEPGIYLPGVGGVRLEDAVVITKTSCEIL